MIYLCDMKINAVIPVEDLRPLESVSEITETSELYYRLLVNFNKPMKFKNQDLYLKIDNPLDFAQKDPRLADPEYVKHHNFLIK
jgi:hypothetical protein